MTRGNKKGRIRDSSQGASGRSGDESGFTLIELLVVVVILPLIIGAAAAALITSFNTESSATNRVSDSVDAQLASAYFVRDVQGASEVTTDQALFTLGKYNQFAPQVCGPTSGAGSLLLAVFRSTSNGTPIDVGYWLDGAGRTTEIDRFSCTLAANFSSTSPVKVVVGSAPPNTATGASTPLGLLVSTQISPGVFQSSAATGWIPTTASTLTGASTALSTTATTIDVASTTGFTTSAPITVYTTSGPQSVTCTGIGTDASNNNVPDFTGCIAGASYTAGAGAVITQSAISGAQIAVTAPASGYNYSLSASPLGGSSLLSHQGIVPALLALGPTGISLTGNGSYNCNFGGNNDKICVNGNIVIDGGTVSCGTNGIYGSGGVQSTDLSNVTCGGTTITSSPAVGDPMLGVLPNCFSITPKLQPGYKTNPSTDLSGYHVPGTYTTQLTGTLEPGVYVAQGGVGPVAIAPQSMSDTYYSQNSTSSYDANSGVLIFLPGPYGGYLSGSGCVTMPNGQSPNSVTLTGNNVITVAPLDANQSSYWFSGNTGAADLWLWQDRTNSSAATTGSGVERICSGSAYNPTSGSFSQMCAHNSSVTATQAVIYGLAYMPAATISVGGTLDVYMGRLIVGGIIPQSGTPGISLTGA